LTDPLTGFYLNSKVTCWTCDEDVVLELVVVVVLLLLLEAALVAVAELKANFLPSTLTVVTGAFPKLKVTLVAVLGIVRLWVVVADNVPCQTVEPPTETAIQLLPVADKEIFGLLAAFFISQVEPALVVLNCLKVAVLAGFLEEDFLEAELLLTLDDELLPETLTELLSTFCLTVE